MLTVVEYMENIVPLEDADISKELKRSFKKYGINVLTSSNVEKVDIKNEICKIIIKTKKGIENIQTDIVLSAVGIEPNTEGIGFEDVGIKTEKGQSFS